MEQTTLAEKADRISSGLTESVILSRFKVLFWIALLALLVSKGAALWPGYALDDYAASAVPRSTLFTLSQGRFTQSALQVLQNLLELRATPTAWPGMLLFLPAASLAIAAGIEVVTRGKGDLAILAGCAALMAAFPYLTEYLTFRESVLPQAVSFALLAYFLVSIALGDVRPAWATRWMRISRIVALVLLAGCQQTAFLVAIFFLLGRIFFASIRSSSKNLLLGLHQNRGLLAEVCLATVVYLLLALALRGFFQAGGDERGQLLALQDVAERVPAAARYLGSLLVSGDPLIARALKVGLLGVLAASFALAARRNPGYALLCAMLWIAMICSSILLLTVSKIWWPVPRAAYAIAFAHGVTLVLLLAPSEPKRATRMLAVAIAFLAVGMGFKSHQILADQQRLNRWDMWVAGVLVQDLLRADIGADSRIVIVGARWYHPVGPVTTIGDLNTSALPVSWAVGGLLREATGRHWKVAAVPELKAVCSTQHVWPDPRSIQKTGTGDVVVCMN